MSFQIEKGIEIPSGNQRTKGGTKYPFAEMEPGDSFVIEVADDKANGRKSSVYTVAKRTGVKVKVAKVEGGLRVWRVE